MERMDRMRGLENERKEIEEKDKSRQELQQGGEQEEWCIEKRRK